MILCLFQHFLSMFYAGLSEREILAQSVIFFIAGYETTATTLALTLYNLAIHPELLEKAIAEVDEKIGKVSACCVSFITVHP